MSNALIAFLAAVSAATWIYTKVSRKTGGGNAKDSLIVAVISGSFIFFMALLLLQLLPK